MGDAARALDTERDYRKQVRKAYYKREEDFDTLREYNDYLEEVGRAHSTASGLGFSSVPRTLRPACALRDLEGQHPAPGRPRPHPLPAAAWSLSFSPTSTSSPLLRRSRTSWSSC